MRIGFLQVIMSIAEGVAVGNIPDRDCRNTCAHTGRGR